VLLSDSDGEDVQILREQEGWRTARALSAYVASGCANGVCEETAEDPHGGYRRRSRDEAKVADIDVTAVWSGLSLGVFQRRGVHRSHLHNPIRFSKVTPEKKRLGRGETAAETMGMLCFRPRAFASTEIAANSDEWSPCSGFF